jgi:hypothetical protein
MQEFLNIALGFPTVIWTALMGLVLAYWLFVILGALDLDLLEIDLDLDLDADFDADLDFDLDADIDADIDADVDVDADADVDGATAPGALARVAVALGIGKVPVTILFSLFTLSGWTLSYFGVLYLSALLGPATVRPLVLGVAIVLSVPLMGALAHPLKGFFDTTTRRAGAELIGKVCVVTTGSVDDSFGQARMEDGGAGLLLRVRCESDNALGRGREALIIGHDREADVYYVEPYQQFLASDDAENASSPELVHAQDWVNPDRGV